MANDRDRSEQLTGQPIPNGTTARTQLKVFNCPATPVTGRFQSKKETPPEQDKIGACADYFAGEGVVATIAAEGPGLLPGGAALPGVLAAFPERTNFGSVSDGTSNTILFAECAGREDIWRGREITPAQTDRSQPNVARARGGAWATNDNPYAIGARIQWSGGSIPVSVPMRINGSNEWGFLYYSFHDGGANFAFADGSVRFLPEATDLATLVALASRAGGEVIAE